MPLFITDEELESLRRSHDNSFTSILSKADSFITNLQRQLKTVEASSITAEQTEQKYNSLSSDFKKLESQNAELNAAIERNREELAVVKSEKHRIHLESIEKDGTIERLLAEVSEIHKSKRQLLGMIEQKDKITEQNTTITSYLEKIGKALIGKHNAWPNEELTTQVHDLTHTEAEELCYSKTTVAEIEEFFSIVCKLVDRYKESAVEWFRKAEDMECAFRALQTHMVETESDYRKKLGEEVSARLLHEKAAADLEEKLKKCDVEIENYRKAKELSLPPISSFTKERRTDRDEAADGLQDSDHTIVPRIPVGVSETSLEASLLHDGWSLAKMYKKYQEAVDALQRESMGRKHSEAVLEMILDKVEQYAILVERDDGGKLPERDLHNM